MRYRIRGERVFGTEQCHPLLRAGLVGHWIGGGSGLTWFDRSGYRNHGVLTNGPIWTLGEGGKRSALVFDGVNDYVEIAYSASLGNLTNNFTVTAWIKPKAISPDSISTIFDTGESVSDGFNFASFEGNAIFVAKEVFAYTSTVPFAVGVWQCVAVVMDSANDATFYVNGVARETVLGTSPAIANSNDKYFIGASPDNTADPTRYFWDGLIDDVRIYNRALSGAEISLLASNS